MISSTPIIERDDFDTVQKRLPRKKYNAPRPGRQKYAYLLSGLVRCHCDSARYMTPKSVNKKGKRYVYYKCTDSSCGSWINAEKLDHAVLDAIRKVALDPSYIRGCYDHHQSQIAELKRQQEPRLIAAQEERTNAERELKYIDNMFMSGVVKPSNADFWNEKLETAHYEMEKANSEYNHILAMPEPLNNQKKNSAILESITGWAELIENADDDVTLKRNLILSTVGRVQCVDRGKFEVDLLLDSTSGAKKIGIASNEVMPNGGKWWSSGTLSTTFLRSPPYRPEILRQNCCLYGSHPPD